LPQNHAASDRVAAGIQLTCHVSGHACALASAARAVVYAAPHSTFAILGLTKQATRTSIASVSKAGSPVDVKFWKYVDNLTKFVTTE